jgi:transcriptional regulator with XRE-family HTH domain
MNREMKRSLELTVETFTFLKESFGRIFKAKRLKAGLTQTEVAKASKVRPETISRIEGGKGNPTVDTLLRLMKAIK